MVQVCTTGACAAAVAATLTVGDAKAKFARLSPTVTGQARFQQQAGLPVLPVSGDVRRQQVHAWYRLGVRFLLNQAADDANRMLSALRPALRNDQLYITTAMMSRIRPICDDMWRIAGWESGSYFQVPDPVAETSWHRFGLGAWTGAGDCDRADISAFTKSMTELLTAAKDAGIASDRVKAVIDDPDDYVFQGPAALPPQPSA